MLSALNDSGAEYLVVGAYAVGAYLPPRATGDLDIWVRPTKENAEKVWQALVWFRAPRHKLTPNDLSTPEMVFRFGVPPQRIDFLTSITGVDFDEAWPHRVEIRFGDLEVQVVGREQLLKNKRATARPKDLADVAYLEKLDPK